jgi:hypothetical protein
LHAPSECGNFWYQWIPAQQHIVKKGDLDQNQVENIRNVIYGLINKYNKPIIFKNLTNSLRMQLISQIAPSAKIIWIKRNPFDTALSVLRARERINIDKHTMWSVRPFNYKALEKLEENEMTVKQIYFIEKQIHRDKKFFPESNFITLNYEDLCSNTSKELKRVKDFIDPEMKIKSSVPSIGKDKKEKIVPMSADIVKLQNIIEQLDWETYEQ